MCTFAHLHIYIYPIAQSVLMKYLVVNSMFRKILIIFLLALAQYQLRAQLIYVNLYVDYDSAWQYRDLKVIPIRWKGSGNPANPLPGKIITLNEALQQGIARISERGTASTENVHWLIVENLSHFNIFIPGGDIIAGGRQDRMITRDVTKCAVGQVLYTPCCDHDGKVIDDQRKYS